LAGILVLFGSLPLPKQAVIQFAVLLLLTTHATLIIVGEFLTPHSGKNKKCQAECTEYLPRRRKGKKERGQKCMNEKKNKITIENKSKNKRTH